MCFVAVPGQDETYRHVHSRFIVTVPSDPKKIAAVAKALGIPEKQFAKFGSGRLLIVNDQASRASKSKKKK
jgi:hypothetical protein